MTIHRCFIMKYFYFLEDGSVLGQWLENILQESTKSRHESKKDRTDDVRSEVYIQSLDIVSFGVKGGLGVRDV